MIRERPKEIARLYTEHFPQKEFANDYRGSSSRRRNQNSLTDEEIISLVSKARNGAKLDKLWGGNTSDYDSHSEADLALVSLLAFYTQDEEQLDSLFLRSGLATSKWASRPDYRRRTIEKALEGLTETYSGPSSASLDGIGSRENSGGSMSPSLSLYKEGTQGQRGAGREKHPRVVRLSEVSPQGERRYLVEGIIPEAYPVVLFGDGGTAKSMLELSLATAVAEGAEEWLGREVHQGQALYLDFELDEVEQGRRAHQLARGVGLERPPEDLLYLSALGFPAAKAFETALKACVGHGVKLLIVDSLGPALEGNAEAAHHVISFYQKQIEPFRAEGVAPLLIDHQSKLQMGERYQSKRAFGSVYKGNLARSVVQVEATAPGEDTLKVRLRQQKHNFGRFAKPFGAKLTFAQESVKVEPIELDAVDLAKEETLNRTDRVKLALKEGSAYPVEIAEVTGIPLNTVKNSLTKLRKSGEVEPTGERNEDGAEQVRLVSHRPPSIRDEDRDTNREDHAISDAGDTL